jgi:Domain of unknown function (DUF3644)
MRCSIEKGNVLGIENLEAPALVVRYVKIDGDPKHWELSECLKQHYGDKNPPERRNLEFLIGLRNKIEHRHLPELDPALRRVSGRIVESRRPAGSGVREQMGAARTASRIATVLSPDT